MRATWLSIFTLLVSPVWAGDGSIEQMDEYSKQRSSASEEEQKLTPAEQNPHDYQTTILSDPLTSPRARATILHAHEDSGEIDDTSSSGTNRVTIRQRGVKNSSSVRQQGDSNALFIDQVGKDNTVHREQSGTSNSARIRVNGRLIENTEE